MKIIKITRDDFARAIAKTEGVKISIGDAKQLMAIIDDVIFNFLATVDEDNPVCIKAFNGIIITAEYHKGGKLMTGSLEGRKTKPSVKLKAEVTKYAKNIYGKELLDIVKEKQRKRKADRERKRKAKENQDGQD